MNVIPIKGEPNERRVSQALIIGVAVKTLVAKWVAMVVVVVALPRMSITPIDLTGHPGGLTPVVVVWEHWHAIDGHPDRSGSRQPWHAWQRLWHRVASILGGWGDILTIYITNQSHLNCWYKRDLEHGEERTGSSNSASSISSRGEWDATKVVR